MQDLRNYIIIIILFLTDLSQLIASLCIIDWEKIKKANLVFLL